MNQKLSHNRMIMQNLIRVIKKKLYYRFTESQFIVNEMHTDGNLSWPMISPRRTHYARLDSYDYRDITRYVRQAFDRERSVNITTVFQLVARSREADPARGVTTRFKRLVTSVTFHFGIGRTPTTVGATSYGYVACPPIRHIVNSAYPWTIRSSISNLAYFMLIC